MKLRVWSFLVALFFTVALAACMHKPAAPKSAAQEFIDSYTTTYLKLYYAANQAEWASNTHIVEGDKNNATLTNATREALAVFTGSQANIESARRFLATPDSLTHLENLQLKNILYTAADSPAAAAELVKARIAAETAQVEKLYGFAFKIDGKEVTPNEISESLRNEKDVTKRLKAWQAAKEVGAGLKPGLVNLRQLRNQTVQGLGYADYFSYQVSDYGMSREEMMKLIDKTIGDLKPLYRELHTWARYELAKRYNQPVPKYLPAHWLPDRWGQDWADLVKVEGINLDEALKAKSPEWLVKQAERFYVSLGFEPLPNVFWQKSSLYPVAKNAGYKKNTHASAWHLDLQRDVRSLMSVESNAEWYNTTHHELGHIYYYLSYTNPQVPPLLREGANRAYHEAVGTLMGLAAMQKPFIEHIGLIKGDVKSDPIQAQLKEALEYVVFIPWSAGVMTHFEHDLYAKNLPADQYNQRWWQLVKQYQGIVPPSPRDERYCDAATKTHINDDAAQYYDYALSFLILMQLHDHLATKVLKQDPHNTNYYGSRAVGDFLKGILTPGATVGWQKMLLETTGEELSARAMLNYFAPVMSWLKAQNSGRNYSI